MNADLLGAIVAATRRVVEVRSEREGLAQVGTDNALVAVHREGLLNRPRVCCDLQSRA